MSITGSASIVDGSDGDANQETIEIEVAPIDFLPALKGEDSRVGNPDGGEITVSFDSDENLVDIEADVRGPGDGTVTEEDFSGNRNDGYEVTYEPNSDGDYTVELVTAEDADGNDGADAEEYADETTVETEDDTGTEEPTEEPTSESTEQTTTDDDGVETESPTGTQPGFGSVVALVALLASALLFYRRRQTGDFVSDAAASGPGPASADDGIDRHYPDNVRAKKHMPVKCRTTLHYAWATRSSSLPARQFCWFCPS